MRTAGRPQVLVAAFLVLLAGAPAAAGTAAQVYYVPLPEDQVHAALTDVFPGAAACGSAGREVEDPILTYVSIAPVAQGTVITYDHWEDGYEPDLSRPAQPSTAIWGDGNASNGIPPGFAADFIGVGDVIVLHNPVRIADRVAVLDFDGGDKLAASVPVAVTRAAWASGTGTLLAGAVDVRETREWGRSFRSPVGQNVAGTAMFEHTSLLVMAARDGTRVAVDADADGSAETAVTLDEGQSWHVRGGVLAGASVFASEPVQVNLITGNVCARHESRWFSLEPEHRWSGSAYAPVSTREEARTTVFVFNPGPGSAAVVRETLAGLDAAVPIAPLGVRAFAVPAGSGARFSSESGGPILAVGTVDTDGSAHEWSFSLIPEPLLTPQALTGWGAGRDPLSGVKPDENGSPVWVTPVLPAGKPGPVAVCVDFNGDNRGTLVDDGGYRYDRLLSLGHLQRARVYDDDGDQTGMLLYVCDKSGGRLAVAWGQDPSAASPGSPGIDLGTTVPPLPSMTAVKEVELAVDADGDGFADPGDTLRYLIRVRNISRRPVAGLVISDELPAHTSYVAGSTLLDRGGGPAALPDDTEPTFFPLDEGGASLGTLPAGAALTVSFLVAIDDPLPANVRTVVNHALVRSATEVIAVEAVLPVLPAESRAAIAVVKSAAIESVGSPGTGTIGYWKNHPESWPATQLSVGGRLYTREVALELMATPGRGDKTYDLFRQFAAALLNTLAGSDDSCIEAALAAADDWLAQHEPGSGVRSDAPAWREAGAELHAALDDYNNGLLCAPHRDAAGAGIARRDVVFTIVVTNTGNVDLADVTVRDPAMPACDAVLGTLAARGGSASSTCRAEGVQADLTNVAVASGTAPDGTGVEARAQVFVDVPAAGGGATVGARSLAVWRGAPGAWPVLELTLAGSSLSQAGVLGALENCPSGDPSCALLGQLAAARLNLLAGSNPACVEKTVAAADAWLAARQRGAAWAKSGKRLTTRLARYNKGLLCAPAAAP